MWPDPLLLRCSGNSLNNLRKGMRSRAERTIPRGGVWLAKEGDEVVGLMVCDLPGQDSPEAYVFLSLLSQLPSTCAYTTSRQTSTLFRHEPSRADSKDISLHVERAR